MMMGTSLNHPDVPSDSLDVWNPPPWPQEHCDDQGRASSFKDPSSGQFVNFWTKDKQGAATFLWRWYTGPDYSAIPRKRHLDDTLPVRPPYWMGSQGEVGVAGGRAKMTWIGHATVLAEVDGKNILCDPVFSSRASAVQFAGPARFRDAACQAKHLPKLDAVVISHNHYDHLDLSSVKDIAKKQDHVQWFVPKGLKQWMVDNTQAKAEKVIEMEWWEESKIEGSDVKVAFLPSNHWCKRGPFDDNKVLWGSWAVVGPRTKYWFGGDTAYCEAFKQIGQTYGPFTMAAIPIGAYQPNWFLKHNHVHPLEAVQIHKDINSKKSLGIHWGTFKLTVEHYLEPMTLLNSSLTKEGIEFDKFVTKDIGGTVDCDEDNV